MSRQPPALTVPERFRRFMVSDDFDRYGLTPGQPAPSPKYLQVELTDLCNLACAGCVRAVHTSSGSHLDLDAFTRLLDDLPDLEHVSFVGAGEALMLKGFADYVSACTSRKVLSSTNTNGLLVRRRLTKVLDAGLGMLAVSVDGASDETLALMRSGLRRSQLASALDHAVELTRERNTSLSAAVTLSTDNLPEFPAILDFVAEHGIRRVTVESLHHWGEDKALNALSLFAAPAADVVPHIEDGLARAESLDLDLTIFDYSRLAEPAAADAVCPWPWDAAYLTRDGEVTPCCVHMEADPDGRNVLGDITTSTIADIWTSPAYEAFRGSFTSGSAWSSCQGCIYRMEFGRV
jgi:MoaA/NifB/PqqE/SkfB family radical SAM enzyme